MKGWQGLLTLSVCLLWTAGCRSPDNNLALERELRYQEDMIFQLQDYVGTYKSYLDECRKENQRLQGSSGSSDDGSTSPRRDAPDVPDVDLSPPQIELPGNSSEEFEPPTIELPGVDQQSDAGHSAYGTLVAQPNRAPAQKSVLRQPTATHSDVALVSYEVSDPVVTQITLNTAQTGGYHSDGAASADGLHILLEPRNAQGDIVPPAGAVSVALLDPKAGTAAEARVAHWNFSPEQVELIAEEANAGRGFAVDLPWPHKAPIRHHLHLFLRLVTHEGKRLVTDQEIDLARMPRIVQASALEEIDQDGNVSSLGWKPRTRPKPMMDIPATPTPSPAASQPIGPVEPKSQPAWQRAADPTPETGTEAGENIADTPAAQKPEPKKDERPVSTAPKRIRRPKWTPFR